MACLGKGMGRDGGLSTLCHSCEFVLKMSPGPGYLHSENEVTW